MGARHQARVNQLCNAEKANAFGAMEALLQDLQNTLHEIQILKTVTDSNNFQAKILTQYKRNDEKEIAGFLKPAILKRKSPSEVGKF